MEWVSILFYFVRERNALFGITADGMCCIAVKPLSQRKTGCGGRSELTTDVNAPKTASAILGPNGILRQASCPRPPTKP